MIEDLRKKDLTNEEIQGIWESRRARMLLRRAYFEPLWRSGISRFFEGIISQTINGTRPLYNALYEQYDISMFSRDGLRFNQIRYPLMHAIIMRALASEIPNKPKVNFVAVGSNDPTKPEAFRHLFDQVLYEMDADQEDFEVFLDKHILGTSICLVLTESYEVTVQDPEYDQVSGEYIYKEKTKKIKQCKYKKLDLRHVLLDEHCIKTNLEDCNYAQIDEYYSPEEFLLRFGGPEYDAAAVLKASQTPMQKEEAQVYQQIYDTKEVSFIRVSHCFDKLADRYHILAQQQLINKKDNPIPRIAGRRGKEIPLALAVQYKIPNAPYGYGESHVTSSFSHLKNLMRLMILEITQKAAKPLMAVDPLSNFDEQAFEWGQDFIRVKPDELREIKTTPDLSMLYRLDELTDNDIIRVTGINFNDTSNIDQGETARKTIIRRESQNALIELMMNYLSNSFFKRLYSLLKDDVRLHYASILKNGEKVQVRSKGVELNRVNGGFDKHEVEGFRYFDLKAEDIDFDMDLDLELGNIASSRELDKALAKEGLDAAGTIPNGFSQDGLAKWIKETYQMPDGVLAKAQDDVNAMDPKELANQGLDPEMLPQTQQMQQVQNNPLPDEQAQEAPEGAEAPMPA